MWKIGYLISKKHDVVKRVGLNPLIQLRPVVRPYTFIHILHENVDTVRKIMENFLYVHNSGLGDSIIINEAHVAMSHFPSSVHRDIIRLYFRN